MAVAWRMLACDDTVHRIDLFPLTVSGSSLIFEHGSFPLARLVASVCTTLHVSSVPLSNKCHLPATARRLLPLLRHDKKHTIDENDQEVVASQSLGVPGEPLNCKLVEPGTPARASLNFCAPHLPRSWSQRIEISHVSLWALFLYLAHFASHTWSVDACVGRLETTTSWMCLSTRGLTRLTRGTCAMLARQKAGWTSGI